MSRLHYYFRAVPYMLPGFSISETDEEGHEASRNRLKVRGPSRKFPLSPKSPTSLPRSPNLSSRSPNPSPRSPNPSPRSPNLSPRLTSQGNSFIAL
ncbi:hypothetical protein AVEN_86298-1 [Araneus ventricosus]|uniref:Uncharacterized protein n=1 Tax=Araneus ventricosus TaxID=182803 RepID=A0A4Y2H4W0_ARAVE|nr:hypothetical protein AVEN_86298-1 [Araneus ventricosus]